MTTAPTSLQDGLTRLQARLAARREATAAARRAFTGDCFECRDTGEISDGLETRPCSHCARGAARLVALRVREATRRREALYAAGGVPRRRYGQTFDTYPDQRSDALSTLRAFAQTWDGERGVLLHGTYGVGKTGLLVGLLHALAPRLVPGLATEMDTDAGVGVGDPFRAAAFGEEERYARLLAWWTTVGLTDALRVGYDDGSYARHLARAQSVRLLVLDDLGAERPTEWVRERLFAVINTRYEACLPTFATTNGDVEALAAQLGPRVLERLLETCDLVEVGGANLRLR